MKYALVVIMLLVSSFAGAAELLTFRDGTTMVFQDRYDKGTDYCTNRATGEFCVEKKDVKKIAKTEQGSEFEVSAVQVDSDIVGQRNRDNAMTTARQNLQSKRDAKARDQRSADEALEKLSAKKSSW